MLRFVKGLLLRVVGIVIAIGLIRLGDWFKEGSVLFGGLIAETLGLVAGAITLLIFLDVFFAIYNAVVDERGSEYRDYGA